MRRKKTKMSASTTVALKDPRFDKLGAPVEVRRHPKARRLTLRVSRTRRAVIVTLPTQCDLGEAGTFVNRHISWVQDRLQSLPQPVALLDGDAMPLRGKTHLIRFTGKRAAPHVGIDGTTHPHPTIVVNGSRDLAPSRLRRWLFDQARRELDDRVLYHARFLGLRPKRIAVRDQSSRWGSCSSTGALSFSWRLIMAPPYVLDYVAAHEVAHLAEMNHGPNFWRLVEKTMPDMNAAKDWLVKFGMDLHRYGPKLQVSASRADA